MENVDLEKVFSLNDHLYHRDDIENMSVCGEGSQMDSKTESLRKNLYPFLLKWNIKSIFDAPCGDFWWMRHIDLGDIEYSGGEIQSSQIRKLNKEFPDKTFIRFDVTKDEFPEVDLWFCRDCLFHFSNHHKLETLNNFTRSNIKYILMSNHFGWTEESASKWGVPVNSDIATGDFTHINWFYPPWNFGEPLDQIYDNYTGHNSKNMILYTREQINEYLEKWKR